MDKWEYKDDMDSLFNKENTVLDAAKHGWEVIFVVPITFLGITVGINYIFRRKIVETELEKEANA